MSVVTDTLAGLQLLWNQQELCDVRVTALDGTGIPCHSLILAAGSQYFRGLFTGGGRAMRESLNLEKHTQSSANQLQDFQVPCQSGSTLKQALQVIYGSQPEVC